MAAFTELGNDEVYYSMYAQYLQWNYFDHPPMVGWLIRLTTFNLCLSSEVFVRLGAIVCSALSTWIFFLCGEKLMNEYTGYLAAILYSACIYSSIIAGVFILPDSPQMLCWVAALYCLLNLVQHHSFNGSAKNQLLLFSLVTGMAMLCKIHSVFLWLGLLLFILLYRRNWFKEPVLYTGGIITLLCFYPVVKWNIDHHFVTWFYHSKRVDVATGTFNADATVSFVVGQFFYFNPVVFILLFPAVAAAFRNKLLIDANRQNLLLLVSLPLIIIATVVSFFKEILPHWTGPGYMGLLLLTAVFLSRQKGQRNRKTIPAILIAANSLLLAILLSGILVINFFPGTMGKKESMHLGDGDITLDMKGWKQLKDSIQLLVRHDFESGAMKKDASIITNSWFPAAHLDHYVAMPLGINLIAIGDTNEIHQYVWINTERRKLSVGDDAYCIVPTNNFFDPGKKFAADFTEIVSPVVLTQYRNRVACRNFLVYRLKGYKKIE